MMEGRDTRGLTAPSLCEYGIIMSSRGSTIPNFSYGEAYFRLCDLAEVIESSENASELSRSYSSKMVSADSAVESTTVSASVLGRGLQRTLSLNATVLLAGAYFGLSITGIPFTVALRTVRLSGNSTTDFRANRLFEGIDLEEDPDCERCGASGMI